MRHVAEQHVCMNGRDINIPDDICRGIHSSAIVLFFLLFSHLLAQQLCLAAGAASHDMRFSYVSSFTSCFESS